MTDKKTILMTGAGSGFGREASFILARQGHDVIATVEAVAQIHDLRKAAEAEGLSIRVEKLDITDEIDRLRAFQWEIDVLVNNAAISEAGAVVDLPEDIMRRQFEINVFAQVLLTQGFARQFITKKAGKVVFVSSVAGLTTDPFTGAYSGSKHAIEAFAEALNKEVMEFGVQVATVNPGPILTGFNDRMFEGPSHWHPIERQATVFDYDQIDFPHEQYDPTQVSDLIAKVATGEVETFRNIVPKEIEANAKKDMEDKWTRKVTTKAERHELVKKAYEMKPGISNGK